MGSRLDTAKLVLKALAVLAVISTRLLALYLTIRIKVAIWFLLSKYRLKSVLRKYELPSELVTEVVSTYEVKVREDLIKQLSLRRLIRLGTQFIKSP